MTQTVYLLVFDGLADWEPAHALCEIRRSGKFDVSTVGFSPEAITTMAGLRITPDRTLDELRTEGAALLMLPGGDMWEEAHGQPAVASLLRRFHKEQVPIGAICGATLEIARAGLTHNARHTSNALSYLKSMIPSYSDEALYVDELAVSDLGLITASGLGCIEFAREIFSLLQLYSEKDLQIWYEMFKHGLIPPNMA